MPGRISTRVSATPRPTQRSSASARDSRASNASAIKPTAGIPDEGPATALRASISDIFADVQRSTAGHRKLVTSLRKIHEACCYELPNPTKLAGEFDEEDFNTELARCLIRAVAVRKSEGVGDRVVRFLGLFLRHATEKDAALLPETDAEETVSLPETPSTRLTAHILSVLLPLLTSKEKTVRFRSTQIISHMVNTLDSIDDDYYHLLRAGLFKRIRDKEPMVRVQAVLGLGRLAGNEGDEQQEDSDDEDAGGLLATLLDVLQNDPSADVRRTLLLNLPLTPATLPFLLERARDLDAATRRALYARLLPALGDFRHLSLSMREKLLRWGLRDRDENVRKAAAKLFRERWIEDCEGGRTTVEGETTTRAPSMDALLELLERIDVVNSGVENGIALEALHEFWDGRPDYRDAMLLDDHFWDHLTTESIFLARSLNDYCRAEKSGKYDALIDEKMPEVTKLAFYLQRYTNDLIQTIRRLDTLAAANGENHNDAEEEDTVEQEFVVEQLLHIARTLDYSDEVGRRKMFALLRETLAMPELPEEITRLVVEVLRDVCGTDSAAEREFCGVVLEAVAEVHDTIAGENGGDDATVVGGGGGGGGGGGDHGDEDESFHSARSEVTTDSTPTKARQTKPPAESEEQDEEKAIREIVVNMKCLHIAQCMLQNVVDGLQGNLHLVTMLNNLVVPAVRSHEAPIRERGLLCLGLCCLLDKTLALENLSLFIHCYTKGHTALQTTALHTLCDILTTHPSLLSSLPDPALHKSVLKVFGRGLKSAQAEVETAAVTALAKLMLTSVLPPDDDLLRQLVVSYFEPGARDNVGARQALGYFLPVFCRSRREHMERMAGCAVGVVHALLALGEELEEEEEMVGMTVVAGMLVDWTDPRKLVVVDKANEGWDEMGRKEVKAVNGDVHLQLAEAILEKILSGGCPKEEKKVLTSMLGKLYISATSTPEKLQRVFDLVTAAVEGKAASDAPSRNVLAKLHAALSKIVGEAVRSKGSFATSPAAAADGADAGAGAGASPADVLGDEMLPSLEMADKVAEERPLDEIPAAEDSGDQTEVDDVTRLREQLHDSVLDELLDEDVEMTDL